MKLPDTMRVFQRGWLSSNNILFLGREETALIDSGYLAHAPQTLALVQHGLQGRPLNRLLNTHIHSDHCGGNALLQREYACRTTIAAAEADKVRQWDHRAMSFQVTGQQCEAFSFTDTMAPGELLVLGDLVWQAYAAPGHDPHSLMFYCKEMRILISADALWENGFGVIFPELFGESGFAETRATLTQIAQLDVAWVIPGHGAPFSDVGAALRRAFSRLDYLMQNPLHHVRYALKAGLKFLLLERGQIALDALPTLVAEVGMFSKANQLFLQLPPEQLAQWVLEQLLSSRAARIEGAFLVNVD